MERECHAVCDDCQPIFLAIENEVPVHSQTRTPKGLKDVLLKTDAGEGPMGA